MLKPKLSKKSNEIGNILTANEFYLIKNFTNYSTNSKVAVNSISTHIKEKKAEIKKIEEQINELERIKSVLNDA